MRGDFIMHPYELLRLMPRMSEEQFGRLTIALCSSAIGEDPGDMDPVVAIAYDFFWDRIQREQEAYDKKAERNRINGKRHVGHKVQGEAAATGAVPIATNMTQVSMDSPDNTTDKEQGKPNATQRKPEKPSEAGTEPNMSLPIPNPIPNPVSQKDICASGKPDALSDVPEGDQVDHCSAICSSDSSACGSSSAAKKKTNAAAEALFEKLWKQYPNKRGKGKVSAAKKRALLEVGEEQMLRALQRYIDEHEAKERQGGFIPAWKNGDTFFNTDYVDYLDENYEAAPRDPPRPAGTCSGFVNYEQSNTDWEAAFEQIMRLQDEEARKSNEDSESQIPAS